MLQSSYEIQDSNQNSYESNLSGTVKQYATVSTIEYPCVLMRIESTKKSIIKLLRDMVAKYVVESINYYTLYIRFGDTVLNAGKLNKSALKVIIGSELFKDFNLEVFVSPDESYSGDFLYAFTVI